METLDELKTWMKEKNINNIYLPNNKNNRYVTDIGEGLEEIYGLLFGIILMKKEIEQILIILNLKKKLLYLYLIN